MHKMWIYLARLWVNEHLFRYMSLNIMIYSNFERKLMFEVEISKIDPFRNLVKALAVIVDLVRQRLQVRLIAP